MKHSFRFIYIFTIIAVIMIVVTMGIFVMKNSHEFTSTVNLTKYDVGEFNSIWKTYEGLHRGSKIKGMFVKLRTNAEENKDKPEMLIDVAYNTTGGSEFKVINSTTKNPNAEAFNLAMGELVVKHAYTVEFIYNEKTGMITGILIKNGKNDKFNFVPDER